MRDYLNFEKLNKLYCTVELLFGELKPNSLLTYVIPTYKRFDKLKRCVESILKQNCSEDFTILISDNDQTTLYEYRKHPEKFDFFKKNGIIYYVNEKNIGGASNCNQAVLLAKTQYICMVHDDDIIHPKHFVFAKTCLEQNSNIKYLSFGEKKIDLRKENDELFINSTIKQNKIEKINIKKLFLSYCYPMLGAIISRDAYIEVGGLEINKSSIEDYIFTYKISEKFSGYYYNIGTYGYSIFENDSLNEDIWNDIICEQYFLRKYIKKKHHFISYPNYILLARDISFLESNKNMLKKMHLDEKYIAKKTCSSLFLLKINKIICNILLIFK